MFVVVGLNGGCGGRRSGCGGCVFLVDVLLGLLSWLWLW